MKRSDTEFHTARRALIEKLATGNKTATQIAGIVTRELGFECTRSAVMGVVARAQKRGDLHVKVTSTKTREKRPRPITNPRRGPAKTPLDTYFEKRTLTLRQRIDQRRAGIEAARTRKEKEPELAPLPDQPRGCSSAVLAITGKQCHWPYGEHETFQYCGRPRQNESSYCERHAQLGTNQQFQPMSKGVTLK